MRKPRCVQLHKEVNGVTVLVYRAFSMFITWLTKLFIPSDLPRLSTVPCF